MFDSSFHKIQVKNCRRARRASPNVIRTKSCLIEKESDNPETFVYRHMPVVASLLTPQTSCCGGSYGQWALLFNVVPIEAP
ncbi:MAG: hypothetical protein V4517_22940 [Pseudomonadota bacterium]